MLARDDWEFAAVVLGVGAAVWSFVKWLATPLVLTVVRAALEKQLAALQQSVAEMRAVSDSVTGVASEIGKLAERLEGFDRRLELLEQYPRSRAR